MDDKRLDEFKDGLQREIDGELDSMPTFSEEMAERIRNVYADLNRQREEWLKTHQDERKEEQL